MRTEDFNYDLPPELIAQRPAERRDASRLLVLHRQSGRREHRSFADLIEYLRAGDLLVLNNSRVIPARLRAFKPGTNGQVEVLLLEENGHNDWWVMLRPGKRVRSGTILGFRDKTGHETAIAAEVIDKNDEGHYRLRFSGTGDIRNELADIGEVPLPPYIERHGGLNPDDAERYQTVFAREAGSVAAPTAGLHFTRELLEKLRAAGIRTAEVTLHVGFGTFAPVKAAKVEEHKMHSERFDVSVAAAESIRETKTSGGRVFAVGTTSLRVLESAVDDRGEVRVGGGKTRLFVYPPYDFKIVDALLTNFHLPESTLLMLVSAFAAPGSNAGLELIRQSYTEAVREHYRFFSYGDAMLIL